MDDVVCAGNESSLTDCPHTTNHNCLHREDASVQCQTSEVSKSSAIIRPLTILCIGITCYDGDVRLVNGRQPHEGRVEICFNETWGTICQRIYLSSYSWNHSQADIVCKQLGYSHACKMSKHDGIHDVHVKISHACVHTDFFIRQFHLQLRKRKHTCKHYKCLL